MNVDGHESAREWAELAIVADSVAAALEEALADAGNATAKGIARLRAEEASADLKQALSALQAERQRQVR